MSMNPEEKKLLEDTFALTQENNKMLHSMRGHMRVQRVMSILYWVFIIGSAVGAFYLIQPYIDQYKSLLDGASETFKSFGQ
jgi:TRAP-type C4-dicarboxylate transport system permease small subunit